MRRMGAVVLLATLVTLATLAACAGAEVERPPAPVVALVPRDSVRGLALVGRLVVTPGEPGLLVFGRP